MAIQKLTAFEKCSIQARHSIKRLEVFIELARSEEDVQIASQMIEHFKAIRSLVPSEQQDTDLKKE